MTPAVSVVLCTYNGEPFIAEQLRSILDQRLPPSEIVIADDGSSDRTLEIVAEIAESSIVPFSIGRNPERLGFADNFLRACGVATGELIAFSDQDDVWLPEKLEEQIEALTRTGAAVCAHDVWEIDSDGAPRDNPRSRTEAVERVVTEGTGDPWGNYLGNTLVFRRGLLDRIPFAERGSDPFSAGDPLAHDRWLYFLGCAFGGIVILPQRLAMYRRHERQLYGTEVARSIRQRLREKRIAGRSQALALARIARSRAALLERWVPEGPERAASVGRWNEIAHRFDRGAAIYERPLPARVLRVVVNAAHGDYLSVRSGGLGFRRLLQDGCLALFAGRDRPAAGPGLDPA